MKKNTVFVDTPEKAEARRIDAIKSKALEAAMMNWRLLIADRGAEHADTLAALAEYRRRFAAMYIFGPIRVAP